MFLTEHQQVCKCKRFCSVSQLQSENVNAYVAFFTANFESVCEGCRVRAKEADVSFFMHITISCGRGDIYAGERIIQMKTTTK